MLKFLEMGGFAAYVWPAYGLTAVVMALNILWARRSLSNARRESRRRLAIARASLRPAETERVVSAGGAHA